MTTEILWPRRYRVFRNVSKPSFFSRVSTFSTPSTIFLRRLLSRFFRLSPVELVVCWMSECLTNKYFVSELLANSCFEAFSLSKRRTLWQKYTFSLSTIAFSQVKHDFCYRTLGCWSTTYMLPWVPARKHKSLTSNTHYFQKPWR